MPGRLSSIRPVTILAGIALLAILPAFVVEVSQTFHIDFIAFWCAGSAVSSHQNPYLDSALHSCEVGRGLLPPLTVPVPYPPYVMPLFVLFAAVPLSVAFALWSCVLLAATALTGAALGRLTKLPWTVTTAATAALVLVWSLMLGQVVPVALCGFAWSLVWMRERRYVLAAAALVPVALLPAFAMPVWLAACVATPRLRLPVLAAGLLLLALSAAVGWPLFTLYVSSVVPAHGASETLAFWQLGTSTLLSSIAIAQPLAVAIAVALFATAIGVGILVGVQLRRRFGGDEWLPASAVAFALLGSPFVHGLDVGFALPLALMIFSASRSPLSTIAALFIIVPWQYLSQNTGISAAIEIPLLLVVVDVFAGRRLLTTVAVVLLVMLGGIATYRGANAANLQLAAVRATRLPALPGDALAEVRWTAFTRETNSITASIYSRTPTQIAGLFLAVAAIVLSISKTEPGRSGIAVEHPHGIE